LGLPYAFYKGGILLSGVSLLILAFITNYCIRLLLECAEELEPKHGKMSFGGLGRVILGKWGLFIVDVSLIFTQTGFCCVYIIFICSNLNRMYDSLSIWEYAVILSVFLILASWIRSLKWMAVLSLIGQTTMIVGLVIIMVISFFSIVEDTPPLYLINFEGIPIFFGMAVYTYEGIGLVVPMRRAMKSPKAYHLVLDIGYICVTILFLLFGAIGYAAYGDHTDPNSITLNLPQDLLWTFATRCLLIVAIFATYPVQLFPVINILEGLLFSIVPACEKTSGWKREHIRNLLRSILVVITLLLAVSIPYFSLFVSLVGALGCSMLAFILPCVFHLKLFYYQTPPWRKGLNVAIGIFGVFASIVSSAVTLVDLGEALFG